MSNPDITIYHNPRCSKSRESLKILTENNCSPTVVHYLDDVPSVEQLKTLIDWLGINPRDLLRKTESAYKEAGLDDISLSDDVLVQAMHDYPILIERPIVVRNSKAIIGRPPTLVLDLIDK